MVLGCGAKVTRSCRKLVWKRWEGERKESFFQLRLKRSSVLHASLSSEKRLLHLRSISLFLFLSLLFSSIIILLTVATPPRACVPEETTQRTAGASVEHSEAFDRTRVASASSASGGDDRSVSSNRCKGVFEFFQSFLGENSSFFSSSEREGARKGTKKHKQARSKRSKQTKKKKRNSLRTCPSSSGAKAWRTAALSASSEELGRSVREASERGEALSRAARRMTSETTDIEREKRVREMGAQEKER